MKTHICSMIPAAIQKTYGGQKDDVQIDDRKRILERSRQQTRLLREGLTHFRHKVIDLDDLIENIDALLADRIK